MKQLWCCWKVTFLSWWVCRLVSQGQQHVGRQHCSGHWLLQVLYCTVLYSLLQVLYCTVLYSTLYSINVVTWCSRYIIVLYYSVVTGFSRQCTCIVLNSCGNRLLQVLYCTVVFSDSLQEMYCTIQLLWQVTPGTCNVFHSFGDCGC